ncbi:MAG: YitT family protein [Angelakisella sp.]
MKKIATYFLGMAVLTLGQNLFVQAGIGAGAFDSFCVGLSSLTPISAGSWVAILSVVMMFLSALLEKRKPQFSVLISSFVFGLFFDFWNLLLASVIAVPLPTDGKIITFTAGLLLAPLGTAIYFTTRFPKSAYDEIIVAITSAFHLPIWASKNIIEIIMILLGICVGGPIAIGTLIIALAFGPILQKYLTLLEKKAIKPTTCQEIS